MHQKIKLPLLVVLLGGSSMFVLGLGQKKPKENSGRCLTCHVTSHDQSLFDKSEHKLHGVACQQCHSAHLVDAADVKDKIEPPLTQAHFFRSPRIAEENRWLTQSLLRQSQ